MPTVTCVLSLSRVCDPGEILSQVQKLGQNRDFEGLVLVEPSKDEWQPLLLGNILLVGVVWSHNFNQGDILPIMQYFFIRESPAEAAKILRQKGLLKSLALGSSLEAHEKALQALEAHRTTYHVFAM